LPVYTTSVTDERFFLKPSVSRYNRWLKKGSVSVKYNYDYGHKFNVKKEYDKEIHCGG
jgi:hypothetical protein